MAVSALKSASYTIGDAICLDGCWPLEFHRQLFCSLSGIKQRVKNSRLAWRLSSSLFVFCSSFEDRKGLVFLLNSDSFLTNASFLTCELAQVVQLSAANFTVLVHLNAVNVG